MFQKSTLTFSVYCDNSFLFSWCFLETILHCLCKLWGERETDPPSSCLHWSPFKCPVVMTEKTPHKSTVFKCVVWWAHCVKHIVLVCRAALSCKGWVGVCSTENMGGNKTTDLGARVEGKKSGSGRDEVLLSQKVWTQLCSDAHQWKKYPKGVGKWQAKRCPLSVSCIWCEAGGSMEDVSVIRPREGCQCDHPCFALCSSVMDLVAASSYL